MAVVVIFAFFSLLILAKITFEKKFGKLDLKLPFTTDNTEFLPFKKDGRRIYAGFWQRLFAALIDAIIISL